METVFKFVKMVNGELVYQEELSEEELIGMERGARLGAARSRDAEVQKARVKLTGLLARMSNASSTQPIQQSDEVLAARVMEGFFNLAAAYLEQERPARQVPGYRGADKLLMEGQD
jgi:hypothetical protein